MRSARPSGNAPDTSVLLAAPGPDGTRHGSRRRGHALVPCRAYPGASLGSQLGDHTHSACIALLSPYRPMWGPVPSARAALTAVGGESAAHLSDLQSTSSDYDRNQLGGGLGVPEPTSVSTPAPEENGSPPLSTLGPCPHASLCPIVTLPRGVMPSPTTRPVPVHTSECKAEPKAARTGMWFRERFEKLNFEK